VQSLLILLGNQLFPLEFVANAKPNHVFLAEDNGLCTYEKHHKLKILMFLAAMREKRDELRSNGFSVEYYDLDNEQFKAKYESKLEHCIKRHGISRLQIFEIEDKPFETRIIKFAETHELTLEVLPSPMFLLQRDEFAALVSNRKTLLMGNFYKDVRKKFKILVDDKLNPKGGQWSFDEDNRKKLPKGIELPALYKAASSKYVEELKKQIAVKFPDHPGSLDSVWMPLTRLEALKALDYFLETRFGNFGSYEDAISSKDTFLFHSSLSPALNMGLITPQDILDKVSAFTQTVEVPLNSVEGFVRQIIGWREFIRGVYQQHGNDQEQANFFGFTGKLTQHWYDGETGIPPLDDAINFSSKFGYTHHINRLMVIANIMTLSEIHPREVYRWFMEMYVDSSEWVMVPNVYGMGTFADGGLFATKPYICGSNYILKMSDYKKGDWCHTVDGLYWRFVSKHMNKIKGNPRLSFMQKTLEKMDQERKDMIFAKADEFIAKVCA
jgi:deoxyribodipyrimidine photolyase-related protein